MRSVVGTSKSAPPCCVQVNTSSCVSVGASEVFCTSSDTTGRRAERAIRVGPTRNDPPRDVNGSTTQQAAITARNRVPGLCETAGRNMTLWDAGNQRSSTRP